MRRLVAQVGGNLWEPLRLPIGTLVVRFGSVSNRRRNRSTCHRKGLRAGCVTGGLRRVTGLLPTQSTGTDRLAIGIAPANVTFTSLTIYGPDYRYDNRNARPEPQAHCVSGCSR